MHWVIMIIKKENIKKYHLILFWIMGLFDPLYYESIYLENME